MGKIFLNSKLKDYMSDVMKAVKHGWLSARGWKIIIVKRARRTLSSGRKAVKTKAGERYYVMEPLKPSTFLPGYK